MVEELKELVGTILGARHVALTDRLIEDLEAESMDIVNITAALEERYAITIDNDDLRDVQTVADLCDVVRRAQDVA